MNFTYWKSIVLITTFLFVTPELQSQETIPREYNPDEFVSFDRTLPLKTALDILSVFSSKHEGKIIIDPQGHTAPIGVMVNNMYWKRALEYILRSNLLKYIEHEKYYEVVPLSAALEAKEEETIKTSTREVEIHAVFFEADYQALIEAGIDWSAIRNGKVSVRGNFGSQVTKDLFSAGYVDSHGKWDVFALLRTFEAMDKGEIIANPQIKVMEGEEGKIKVGTNFFLTTKDFAGNTRFTEYEAGVILTVTPQVIGTGDSTFIHLDIKAERSSVFPDPVSVTKAITESRTQVLLLNGEETVIAGLFSDEARSVRRGIPILKDLPPWFFGLRYLFGYSSKEIKKKELIILLQASVIPTVAERMNMRLGQRNHLEENRLQFKRRLQQLKSQRGTQSQSSLFENDHKYSSDASSLPKPSPAASSKSNMTYSEPPFYYGVELGPFNDRNEAQRVSNNYKAKGYKVGMLQKNDPASNSVQYSLVIGAYKDPEEAQRLANYFRSRAGIDGKVIRFKNTK